MTDHTTKLPAAIGICPECRWWVSWKDHDECPECDTPLVRFDKRDDIVRAFAEWYRKHWSEYNWEDGPPPAAEAYLASLAAKEEER